MPTTISTSDLIRLTTLQAALYHVEALEELKAGLQGRKLLTEADEEDIESEAGSEFVRVARKVPWLLRIVHQLNKGGEFDAHVLDLLRKEGRGSEADRLRAVGGAVRYCEEQLKKHNPVNARPISDQNRCGIAIIGMLIICTICLVPGGQAACPACVGAIANAILQCSL